MMRELKNPDWTKTPEERDEIRKAAFSGDALARGSWKVWWNIEHQYPYQNRFMPIHRRWLNPFYSLSFSAFWIVVQKESGDGKE